MKKGGGIIFGGNAERLLRRHAGQFLWRSAYRILGIDVAVHANRERLLGDPLRFFDHFRVSTPESENEKRLSFWLVADDDGGSISMALPTGGILRLPTEERLAAFLGGNIMHQVYALQREYAVIHAAAVGRGNRSFIFLGDSGIGKSTLTIALLRKGFAYLSDDLAPIERGTLRVVPFPRYMQVREGTASLLAAEFGSEWLEGAQPISEERAWLVDPLGIGICSPAVGYDLAGIISLRKNWGGRSEVTPVPALEAIQRLVRHWANRYYLPESERRGMLKDLIRAATSAPCWELSVGSLAEAVNLADEISAHGAAPDVNRQEIDQLREYLQLEM